jgi:RNA polymerase sigma-70 factor (ECF subfamily)
MEKEIEQFYTPLYRYIKKRVNSAPDAEDLTQEVFVKLIKSNTRQVENVRSWVYTIARNTITDYYRKKQAVSTTVEEQLLSNEEGESQDAFELSKCIRPFVKQLPENYRNVIELSELQGKSQKVIAAELNMNYVTVRSMVQRGRTKLKRLIVNCCTVQQGGRGSIIDVSSNNKGCSC